MHTTISNRNNHHCRSCSSDRLSHRFHHSTTVLLRCCIVSLIFLFMFTTTTSNSPRLAFIVTAFRCCRPTTNPKRSKCYWTTTTASCHFHHHPPNTVVAWWYHTRRQRQKQQHQFRGYASSSSSSSDGFPNFFDSPQPNDIDTPLTAEEENQMYQVLKYLSNQIRQHDIRYYNKGMNDTNNTSGALISDEEYDALVRRETEICNRYPHLLQKWEQESGLGMAATRRGRIGAPVLENNNNDNDPSSSSSSSIRTKRTHLQKMLSLDNIIHMEELLTWLNRIRRKLIRQQEQTMTTQTQEEDGTKKNNNLLKTRVCLITEPKLDGVSLSLRYAKDKDGNQYQLQWASTRGDGTRGLDVTQAARMIPSLPWNFTADSYDAILAKPTMFNADIVKQRRALPDILEIRGEVVLPKSVFKTMRQQHKQQVKKDNQKKNKTSESNNSTTKTMDFFSNARNAASGILLRKEDSVLQNSEELRAQLKFIAYDVVFEGESVSLWISDAEMMQNCLVQMGFLIPEPFLFTSLPDISTSDQEGGDSQRDWDPFDIDSIAAYYEDLKFHRAGEPILEQYEWGDYEMDGCVHKIFQCSLREILGSSNRSPRWAIAQKFLQDKVVTDLLDIDVQVGRTGALTPVAILSPVKLDGITVRRATLHNFQHMRQLLGNAEQIKKGSMVLVRRAGDVIPQVVGKVNVLDPEENVMRLSERYFVSLLPPELCPACGSKTAFDDVKTKKGSKASQGMPDCDKETEYEGEKKNIPGAVLRCTGPALLCPPRAIAHLQHAFSRDALDISGMSEARSQQLMDAGMLRRPSDIFLIATDEQKQKEIAALKGWGTKSAENVVAAARRVARQGLPLSRFIYSLGIRHCGKHSSTLLAAVYGTAKAFLEDMYMAAKVVNNSTSLAQDLEKTFARLRVENPETKNIGPTIIGSLVDFAKEKSMVEEARLLETMIFINDDETYKKSQADTDEKPFDTRPMAGLKVVFTGTIENMSRDKAQSLAKEMGARSTPDNLSRFTDLLVVGSKGGSKVKLAEKYGVAMIDSVAFLRMVQEFRDFGSKARQSDS